ncbi:MFS transporter [Marimonas arenosa]|uniref:MFS transporter n=1 Tax=Marimonas arenosa TaxID=1795305 RepID=A0AAE3WB61_9RHOB|nr:MFS transporter [Marimonas arenosa]MDQ2088577.1 MFS transporter [Marimonas arenosa]
MSTAAGQARTPKAGMGRVEFITLMAMLFAMVAFSIDSMLPALPRMAAELTPEAPNRAQLILTFFVIGLGLGTFVMGPVSDAFGRKPVILASAGLYLIGAALATLAQTLELMLLARALQGLGAAGPRVAGMAVIRDLFAGREMARIMSFVMMIFVLFPAVAPLIGAGIIALSGGWRSVFVAFLVFGSIGAAWMQLRLAETLPRGNRRPFRASVVVAAAREAFALPMVRLVTLVLTLCFGMFFAMLQSVQPIFDQTFGRADTFPVWFFFLSLGVAAASLLNTRLVMRFGMRRIVTVALAVQVAISGMMLTLSYIALPATWEFALFLFWQASMFFQAGVTIGNLNAMGMEPLGHIAGMAASVIGGISTVFAMALAAPLGLAFDGSIRPLATGVFVLSLLAVLLMLRLRRVEQMR